MRKAFRPAFAAVLFFATLSSTALAREDTRVDGLIRISGAAIGAGALAKIKVLHVEAAITGVGLKGTNSSWQEMGGMRFSEMTSLPPLVQLDGFDGKAAWQGDRSHLIWVDGSEQGRAQELASVYTSNYTLWSHDRGGATVTWGGSRAAGAKTYEALIITPKGAAAPFEMWFDRSSHVPVRIVQTIGPRSSTSTYSDYRKVAGILFPFAGHQEGNDGNSSDTKVVRVTVNPPGGSLHLTKPASLVRDSSIAGGALQTVVPFNLVENHVYLQVMLNGKGPYQFIFDTGGQNVVDPAVAQEIGAAGHGSAQGGGVGAQTESLSFAKVDTLGVGDAVVKDQIFAVAPTRQGFGISGGRSVDGLIGFEVLSRFVTTFDYANNQVILQLPSAATPPAGAQVLPFVFYGSQPQFACTIDALPSVCTLDTGARDSISLFAPFLIAHPQVVPAKLSEVGVNGFGFGGASMGRLGRLQSVGIGKFLVSNVVGDFTTQTKGALAVPFISANVGGNLLRRFTMTLDYGKQTMALIPNSAYAQPDVYERAGLFLINRGGKKTIYDARPGTAAARAGLAKGDVIETIDGNDAGAMSLQDVRQVFFGAAGTTVQLGITSKAGDKKVVPLTLEDVI